MVNDMLSQFFTLQFVLFFFFRERNLVSDHSSVGSLSSANAAGRIQHLHLADDLSPDEMQENIFSLQAGSFIRPNLLLCVYLHLCRGIKKISK